MVNSSITSIHKSAEVIKGVKTQKGGEEWRLCVFGFSFLNGGELRIKKIEEKWKSCGVLNATFFRGNAFEGSKTKSTNSDRVSALHEGNSPHGATVAQQSPAVSTMMSSIGKRETISAF
jgi:hypothetical protein